MDRKCAPWSGGTGRPWIPLNQTCLGPRSGAGPARKGEPPCAGSYVSLRQSTHRCLRLAARRRQHAATDTDTGPATAVVAVAPPATLTAATTAPLMPPTTVAIPMVPATTHH